MNVSMVRVEVGFVEKGMRRFGTTKLRGLELLGEKVIAKGSKRVITLLIIVQLIKLLKS